MSQVPDDPADPQEPQELDLTNEHPSADLHLHRFEASGLWGIGSLKFSSTGKTVGTSFAWVLIASAPIGAGYAVNRLAASAGLSPITTVALVMLTALVVLATGIWFVTHTNHKE